MTITDTYWAIQAKLDAMTQEQAEGPEGQKLMAEQVALGWTPEEGKPVGRIKRTDTVITGFGTMSGDSRDAVLVKATKTQFVFMVNGYVRKFGRLRGKEVGCSNAWSGWNIPDMELDRLNREFEGVHATIEEQDPEETFEVVSVNRLEQFGTAYETVCIDRKKPTDACDERTRYGWQTFQCPVRVDPKTWTSGLKAGNRVTLDEFFG